MGECVIIYGKSGSGKSRSLKEFAEDEILFINTVKALTNADRIRSMTDEEMVNQFTETMGFCCPVKGVDCSLEPDCRACFDRWLKQEVTE